MELEADLEPSTVIDAYRRGLFPMGISELAGLLGWWSPNPRGILPLDGLRVTRSMRQSAKRYEIRVNTCFTRVMQGCADPSREGGWITGEITEAYTRLHELGWAHSIEVFDRSGRLAGGLYGVGSTDSSPASRCFTSSATHRRSRSWRWWISCGRPG